MPKMTREPVPAPPALIGRAVMVGGMGALVASGIVACAAGDSAEPSAISAMPRGDTATVVSVARSMIGRPYEYGGAEPSGFDCSGLVSFAYQRTGIEVPRTVAGQLRAAERVPRSALEPGDLVFFELGDKPAHVGIYAGNGAFIHAPSSGGQVQRSRLDRAYWQQRFMAAGRL